MNNLKKTIEELLSGKFRYEQPGLLFSKEKIEVTLKAGDVYRGELYFGTEDNQRIRGYITSSNRRVVPGTDQFTGTTIRLQYGVDGVGMNPDDVSTVAQGSQLVKVRDEYMPVIALEKIFQVPRFDLNKTSNIMVVVEADGSRVALLVDELLGQHQVVVKNLESNYRKVPNVSGATILGDGTVALILDIGGLVRRARH